MREACIARKENAVKKLVKKRLQLNREVMATLVSERTATELRQVDGGRPNPSGDDACSNANGPCTASKAG